MSDRVLTYLQGDSRGARRDLIACCYYEAAQGDPKSGPVVFAVLLDACAEQFAKTPQELVKATTDFQQVVTKAIEWEDRMIARTDQTNAAVVAEFKDETRRANDTLREIVSLGNITIDRGKRIDQQLQPIATHLERIADKVYILNENLRENHESATKTAAAADKIHNVYETTLEPVKRLTRDVRFLLASGGFLGGMLFDQLGNQTELLPWTGLVALFLILGWIQYLLRKSWQGAFWLAEKWKSSVKPWLRLLLF